MTVEEAIQRVWSMESRGVQTFDSRLTERHIYSCLLTARAVILSQKVNKKQAISQWIYQTLSCVPMTKASPIECAGLSLSGDCGVLRSVDKLPKPITGLKGSAILSVTSVDGSENFDITEFHLQKYGAGNKYTKNRPDGYFRNGYLYITGKKALKAITVVLLCDDPVEAEIFNIKNSKELCNTCYNVYDFNMYIDKDSEKPIIDIAQQEAIGLFKQMTQDKSTNTDDDNAPSLMTSGGQ